MPLMSMKRAGTRRRLTKFFGTRDDIMQGVRAGALFASGLFLLALVAMVFGRGGEQLSKLGISFAGLLAIYALGAILGGGIAGALTPIVRSRPGAAFVGFIATLPVTLPLAYLALGPTRWFPAGLWIAALASLVIGGGLAVVVRDDGRRS